MSIALDIERTAYLHLISANSLLVEFHRLLVQLLIELRLAVLDDVGVPGDESIARLLHLVGIEQISFGVVSLGYVVKRAKIGILVQQANGKREQLLDDAFRCFRFHLLGERFHS